jgi:hypothetical protein
MRIPHQSKGHMRFMAGTEWIGTAGINSSQAIIQPAQYPILVAGSDVTHTAYIPWFLPPFSSLVYCLPGPGSGGFQCAFLG